MTAMQQYQIAILDAYRRGEIKADNERMYYNSGRPSR